MILDICTNRKLTVDAENSRNPSPPATRPRAATTFDKTASGTKSTIDQLPVHGRSKSELTRSRSRESRTVVNMAFRAEHDLTEEPGEEAAGLPQSSKALVIDTVAAIKYMSNCSASRTPMTSSGLFVNELVSASDDQGSVTPQTPESLYMTSIARPGTAHTADSQLHNTFLNMSEESQDESPEPDKKSGIPQLGKLEV